MGACATEEKAEPTQGQLKTNTMGGSASQPEPFVDEFHVESKTLDDVFMTLTVPPALHNGREAKLIRQVKVAFVEVNPRPDDRHSDNRQIKA